MALDFGLRTVAGGLGDGVMLKCVVTPGGSRDRPDARLRHRFPADQEHLTPRTARTPSPKPASWPVWTTRYSSRSPRHRPGEDVGRSVWTPISTLNAPPAFGMTNLPSSARSSLPSRSTSEGAATVDDELEASRETGPAVAVVDAGDRHLLAGAGATSNVVRFRPPSSAAGRARVLLHAARCTSRRHPARRGAARSAGGGGRWRVAPPATSA